LTPGDGPERPPPGAIRILSLRETDCAASAWLRYLLLELWSVGVNLLTIGHQQSGLDHLIELSTSAKHSNLNDLARWLANFKGSYSFYIPETCLPGELDGFLDLLSGKRISRLKIQLKLPDGE
jgi:hypothetical protein